jgi:hypothetical protein
MGRRGVLRRNPQPSRKERKNYALLRGAWDEKKREKGGLGA